MNILAAVVLIAVLVIIHEFGHFVVAKACGVAVPVFSIGFGRRLVGFEFGGTDYRISALPFGGYVRMAGADAHGYVDEEDELEDPSKGFLARPLWQRILVILAGPVFNLVLPVVVLTVLFMAGEPQQSTRVGNVVEGSPVAQAGLLPGDRILAVDGTETPASAELYDAVAAIEEGSEVELRVERDGSEAALRLVVPASLDETGLGLSLMSHDTMVGVSDPASPAGLAGVATGDRVRAVGEEPVRDWVELNEALAAVESTAELELEDAEGARRRVSLSASSWTPTTLGRTAAPAERWGLASALLFVEKVQETVSDENGFLGKLRPSPAGTRAPAHLAGIQPGDHLLAVDGRPLARWGDVTRSIRDSMVGEGPEAEARPVEVALMREGKLLRLEMTPRIIEHTNAVGRFEVRPIIGVSAMGGYAEPEQVRRYYAPGPAVKRAVEETTLLAGHIVDQLGKLVTGEAAFDKSVGGPVEMVRQASKAAEAGIFHYARLMGMLSLSLGIVNLLPVPVLDGGQLLFFVLEAVRGRPVSVAMRERALQIGVLVMVLLMLAVLVKDVSVLVGDMMGSG